MWRNTGQPVRVLMLDARACLPVVLAAVYWSWTTLYIAIAGFVFFSLISFFGLTLPALGPDRAAVDRGQGADGGARLAPEAFLMSAVDLDRVGRTMRVSAGTLGPPHRL